MIEIVTDSNNKKIMANTRGSFCIYSFIIRPTGLPYPYNREVTAISTKEKKTGMILWKTYINNQFINNLSSMIY